jgi:hypothetical protein
MAVLDASLAASVAGESRVVLVSGEAGAGKTRLLAEFRAVVEARGCRWLEGRCFELDATQPYAPWTDLLRRSCTSEELASAIDGLGPLAPDFGLMPTFFGGHHGDTELMMAPGWREGSADGRRDL